MVNHDKLNCFKCGLKINKSAFRQFGTNTTLDGIEWEDRKDITNDYYFYCPHCLLNLALIGESAYIYEAGTWVKIKAFKWNPSRRDN